MFSTFSPICLDFWKSQRMKALVSVYLPACVLLQWTQVTLPIRSVAPPGSHFPPGTLSSRPLAGAIPVRTLGVSWDRTSSGTLSPVPPTRNPPLQLPSPIALGTVCFTCDPQQVTAPRGQEPRVFCSSLCPHRWALGRTSPDVVGWRNESQWKRHDIVSY